MKKIARLHDKFYLKENRYRKTKDSFKLLIKILKKKINKNKVYNILDVGCANGELTYNLEKNFKNFNISGTDVRQDLLDKAIKNNSQKITFFKSDISGKVSMKKKYDIIICAGVLAIFDDQKKVLNNLKKYLKKQGQIYLFGNFNKYPYDVYIKYKDLKKNKNVFQSGWNVWSLLSIKNFFKSKKIEIKPFNIKKKINQKPDLVRSWTIKIKNKNHFTNGLSVVQNQFWIRIY